MSTSINLYFSVLFLNAVLGFIVAGILYFVSSRNTFTAKLLSYVLVALNVLNLNMVLSNTNFFLHFPWMWRVLAPASFCIGPLAYLYVRSVLEQSFRIKRSDLFMFVVPVLYMLQLYPLFFSPMSHKLEVVQRWMTDRSMLLKEPEGLLPIGWATIIRVLYSAFFQVLQFKLIFDWRRRISATFTVYKQNLETYRWLIAFSIMLSVMYVLVFFELAFHMFSLADFTTLIMLTVSLTSLVICLYLMARPNILYGLTGWLQESATETGKEEAPVEQVAVPAMAKAAESLRLTLSKEQGMMFKEALENHFQDNHPFTKTGYTLGDLSAEIKVPAHLLSAFINQEYGKNFNELINTYRVDYLEAMVRDSEDAFQYTLEALGKMAGFNSRTAFIAAVKKKTGKTPSELFNRRSEAGE